ncbi:uncharacterized protein LOC133225308 [Neopsephotus bourkii]|uniref:uncharacterized protein LOC133225308 n=1 Tax=Neopsephotus bourkii TaxID=309878 RepID=UPI002AA54B5F|nr:uncharacterized protein LOC133225308 [Neopsephotus bourkii]
MLYFQHVLLLASPSGSHKSKSLEENCWASRIYGVTKMDSASDHDQPGCHRGMLPVPLSWLYLLIWFPAAGIPGVAVPRPAYINSLGPPTHIQCEHRFQTSTATQLDFPSSFSLTFAKNECDLLNYNQMSHYLLICELHIITNTVVRDVRLHTMGPDFRVCSADSWGQTLKKSMVPNTWILNSFENLGLCISVYLYICTVLLSTATVHATTLWSSQAHVLPLATPLKSLMGQNTSSPPPF